MSNKKHCSVEFKGEQSKYGQKLNSIDRIIIYNYFFSMVQLDKSKVLSDQERIILKRCKDSVIKIDPDAEVILYGSRARGDSHNESDYDLLIKGEKKSDLEYENNFRKALYPIELETGAVLTVIYIDNKSWNSSLYKIMPFYKNITREGIAV